MFKIGEFSKLTQVSIRMLRYYDEMGLLKPAEIDKFTGYRMYSAEQISTLQKIVLLRDSKFKIAEIKEILLKEKSINIIDELEKQKDKIKKEIQLEQERLRKIDNAINEIKSDNLKVHCNINFKKVNKMRILSLRDRIPTYFHEGILWDRLFKFIEENNVYIKNDIYNNVALYHDVDHKDSDVDVEVGVLVETLGKDRDGFTYRDVEAVDKVAYAMIYGPYENLSKGYEMLAYYLEKHNEVMAEKPSRQISHVGICDTDNPEEYLTEIQIPLK